MGGVQSQVGCTTAGGQGESWPAKFARSAGSTIRIDGGSAHLHRSLVVEVSTPLRLMEPAVQGSPKSGESGMSAGVHATALSLALLAHLVPPLPVFSGEGDIIGGSFREWHGS